MPLQRVAQFIHALKALIRAHGQRLHHRFDKRRRHADFDGGGQHLAQRVGNHARHRLRRRPTGQQKIQHRTEPVHIRPRALAHGAVVNVLLNRRIAGLENGGQRLRHAAYHQPRRAQIEQHRVAVTAHQNVVRRHVTMNHVLRVQQRHRVKNRLHHAANVELVKRLLGLPQLAQRLAVVETHGHVGGGVLLPHPMYLNHRWVRKTRQQLRFTQKVFQP